MPQCRLFLLAVLVVLAAEHLAAPAAAAGKAAARDRGSHTGKRRPKKPTVELYHVNHKETLQLQFSDNRGRPVKGLQKRIEHFLRCHYTNEEHKMSPRLARLLYQVGCHYPGHRIEVVSGYRHPKFARNPRSPHKKGLACDFRVDGVKNTVLRDYLRRTFDKIGVGYYPNSTFIHVDVRKDRSAFWIDYSGPGEPALYSTSPMTDLRSGRAESFHPAKIEDARIEIESNGEDERNDSAPPTQGRAAGAERDVKTSSVGDIGTQERPERPRLQSRKANRPDD